LREPDRDLAAHLDPEFVPPSASGPKQPAVPRVERAFAWIDRHRQTLLVSGVVFQVLVLLAMVVSASAPLLASGSRTVLLRVVPVDPRDLFRGEYVILSYEISWMPVPDALPGMTGQTVYVTLAPEADNRHYRGVSASIKPPARGPGALPYMRGTLDEPGRIAFGIESYFVPEGQGQPYEAAARSRRLSAEVALAPNGQAALKSLIIE
jgi:uncharacterized membrane-anchored protein